MLQRSGLSAEGSSRSFTVAWIKCWRNASWIIRNSVWPTMHCDNAITITSVELVELERRKKRSRNVTNMKWMEELNNFPIAHVHTSVFMCCRLIRMIKKMYVRITFEQWAIFFCFSFSRLCMNNNATEILTSSTVFTQKFERRASPLCAIH